MLQLQWRILPIIRVVTLGSQRPAWYQMTARAHHRGHPMWFDESIQEWRYNDSSLAVKDHHKSYPCGHCGLVTTPEGHDPCIANLPGVQNACCGHGEELGAYIQFQNGTRIKGAEAIRYQEGLRQACLPPIISVLKRSRES